MQKQMCKSLQLSSVLFAVYWYYFFILWPWSLVTWYSSTDYGWCLLCLTCVDCYTASVEEEVAPSIWVAYLVDYFGLRTFFNVTSVLACVTKARVRVISMMCFWQTNVWFTCCSAMKNDIDKMESTHLCESLSFSMFFPKDHAGSISGCLDTCRGSGLDEEGCQQEALVNREIIQTVGH